MTRAEHSPSEPPATETDEPAAHPRRWAILGVLALSLVIISLDNTVLNVALPSMQRSLHASSNQLQWIIDAYTLVFAGLVLLGGNLGDRYGRKGMLQLGLLVLAGGSTLIVLADTPALVIGARAVMGVGGALIMPATLSITSTVFRGAERAKAIAVWAACAAIGVTLGPIVGGWLLEHYWWGSVFLINIPIVLVALIAGAALIPSSRDEVVHRLDLAGAALSTVGLTALVYAIVAGPDDGWSSETVVVSFAVSAIALSTFMVVERRTAHPMLPLGLFRSARFSTGVLAIVLTFMVLLGGMFFLTQYLQVVRGYSTFAAGLRTLPLALGLAVAAPRSAGLAVRVGTKAVVSAGLFLNGCGLIGFGFVTAHTDYALIAVCLALIGLGMGATMAPATEAVMGTVPAELAGIGSAVNDAARQLGSTIGVAVLGSVLTSRYGAELRPALRSVGAIPARDRSAILDSIAGAHSASAGTAHPALVQAAANSAFVMAMGVTAIVAAGVAFAGAGVVAVFLPSGQPVTTDLRNNLAARYIARHGSVALRARPVVRRRAPGTPAGLLFESNHSS